MKLEYFEDCYKTLNLNKKAVITDEEVFEAYEKVKIQLMGIWKKVTTKDEIERLHDIEIRINDSYKMLQTEEKRKKYNEFLDEVEKIKERIRKKEEEEIEQKEDEKIKNEVQQEEVKREDLTERQQTGNYNREKEINFIPIYKGQFNKLPEKDEEEER